jgi:hypothetical protein
MIATPIVIRPNGDGGVRGFETTGAIVWVKVEESEAVLMSVVVSM